MCYGLESDREEYTNKTVKTVAVKDYNLLYRLSDKNLLDYLLNVSTDWGNPNKKVFIFELNSYVQDEINEFYFNKRKSRY